MINDIDLEEYNYFLPDDKIALYPVSTRSESKLLHVNLSKNTIEHFKFYDVVKLVPQNSLLVRNTTKVIPARMFFRKPGTGRIELLLLKPLEPSIVPQIVMDSTSTCTWECMVGGRGVNELMILSPDRMPLDYELEAKVISRNHNKAIVRFEWSNPKFKFSHILMHHGQIPLPPYIKRQTESSDSERYQTVYATDAGSVAAPTAGLHFTDDILDLLKKIGTEFCNLTLHVGTGTFVPISDNNISSHQMHSESFYVEISELRKIVDALANNKPIIAVGTTSVRTLESLYWCSVNEHFERVENSNVANIPQWAPYQANGEPPTVEVFNKLISGMEKRSQNCISGDTSLFIVPGYKFKVISGMFTNFHQPKSTLILLVAAFLGKNLWRQSYSIALNSGYRFLSYGDSSLLL